MHRVAVAAAAGMAGQASDAGHACCADKDKAPAPCHDDDDSSCADGCVCYCCAQLIAHAYTPPAWYSPQGAHPATHWRVKTYTHEYRHPIWQPPQALS